MGLQRSRMVMDERDYRVASTYPAGLLKGQEAMAKEEVTRKKVDREQ